MTNFPYYYTHDYRYFFFHSSRLNRVQSVLLTHGDSIDRVGNKLKVGATSSNDIVAAIYNDQQRIYGVQFHPEVNFEIQKLNLIFH